MRAAIHAVRARGPLAARRSIGARALLSVLFLLGAAANAEAGEKIRLRWRGKETTTEALPADFPAPAREALQRFEPFCRRAAYRIEVDAPGRVLLIVANKASTDEHQRALARTTSWFDAQLPAPQRTAAGLGASSTGGADEPEDGGIPEDPEAPPAGAPPAPSTAPLDGGSQPAAFTPRSALLFVLRNEADYGTLLEELARIQPALQAWTEVARKETGFVVPEPLCAAYLESASGMEEWSPIHELVHRAAQLLLQQRFGMQPFWFQQGLGWCAEWAFDGSLYCFPYRDEFVGIGEHGAWPVELKRAFGDPAAQEFPLETLCAWRRGKWDVECARLAFGLSAFLLAEPAAKLSQGLEELRSFRDQDDRTPAGDGHWVRDPHYEVAPARQLALLEGQLGPGLLKRAGGFLSKGLESFRPLQR